MADIATWTNAGIGLGGFLLGIGAQYGSAKARFTALSTEVTAQGAAIKKLTGVVALKAAAVDVKVLAEEVEDLDDLKRTVDTHEAVLFKPDRSLNVVTAEACDKSTADYRQRICTKLDEIKHSHTTSLAPVDKQLTKIFEWITAQGELVGAIKAHLKEHKNGG